MHELNLTSQQYGWVASSFFSLYAVSGVLVGLFVAHRVRSKLLLTALVLIWSMSQLPVVFFGSLTTLVGGRMLLGVGEGPGTPSATAACHEWFTPDRRNMPTAFLMLGAGIGSLLAGPVLSYAMIAYGWRAGFLLCSLLGLCWVGLWQVFGANGPPADPDPQGSVSTTAAASTTDIKQTAIWLDPTILGTIVVGFTAYWSTGFTLAWLAPLVRSGLGYNAATTGWIVSVVAGVNSAVLLAVTYISQRLLTREISSRWARGILNGLCMLGGGAALLGAAFAADPVQKLVLVAIGGALPTLTFTLGPALLSEIVPSQFRSRFLITIYAGITVAGFAAPLVAGQLIGKNGIGGYDRALVVNALVVVVGGFVGLWLLQPEKSLRRIARLSKR